MSIRPLQSQLIHDSSHNQKTHDQIDDRRKHHTITDCRPVKNIQGSQRPRIIKLLWKRGIKAINTSTTSLDFFLLSEGIWSYWLKSGQTEQNQMIPTCCQKVKPIWRNSFSCKRNFTIFASNNWPKSFFHRSLLLSAWFLGSAPFSRSANITHYSVEGSLQDQ